MHDDPDLVSQNYWRNVKNCLSSKRLADSLVVGYIERVRVRTSGPILGNRRPETV